VTDGQDGLIVPVRNASALAAAIRSLHDNPGWARQLGQAARNKALAEFDERIVISRTLGVYAELLPQLDGQLALKGPAAEPPALDPPPEVR
jgi:glycosyltransferase involved in cell wall biosynthesis